MLYYPTVLVYAKMTVHLGVGDWLPRCFLPQVGKHPPLTNFTTVNSRQMLPLHKKRIILCGEGVEGEGNMHLRRWST